MHCDPICHAHCSRECIPSTHRRRAFTPASKMRAFLLQEREQAPLAAELGLRSPCLRRNADPHEV